MIDFSTFKELTIDGIKLKELYIDDILAWKAGRLPAGYVELEYIEGTGTQCLDSGITGHTGITVEAKVTPLDFTGTDTSNGCIIGSSTDDDKRVYLSINNSSEIAPFAWELGAKDWAVKPYDSEFGRTYSIKVEWLSSGCKFYVDDKFTEIELPAIAFENNETDNKTNMYILGRNKNGAQKFCKARLHSMRIWDYDTLVRDYIPAMHRYDAEVGLYDLVSRTFFSNIGTGAFIAGVAA